MKLKVLKLYDGKSVAINPDAISSMIEKEETVWKEGSYSTAMPKKWFTMVFMRGDPPEIYFKLSGRLNENVLEFLE
jgi:hypothetical protein